ncbi:MAG: hypothetical protein AB1599_03940 [Planctomycetota bacterium]
MFIRFIGLICVFTAGCLAGCSSSQPQPDTRAIDSAVIREQGSINSVFNRICKLMRNGEPKEVYDYYLSKSAQKSQNYADFANEYEMNKQSWFELFEGATLKHIAPEERVASAVVLWGNGDSSLIEFSKEDGDWKINYLRGPARVMEGGTQMPAPSPK